ATVADEVVAPRLRELLVVRIGAGRDQRLHVQLERQLGCVRPVETDRRRQFGLIEPAEYVVAVVRIRRTARRIGYRGDVLIGLRLLVQVRTERDRDIRRGTILHVDVGRPLDVLG